MSYSEKLAQMRQRYGGVCQQDGCDATERLEFAHVKITTCRGRGRGQGARFRDIRDNPTAYILLCRTHHAELDGLPETFHNYT